MVRFQLFLLVIFYARGFMRAIKWTGWLWAAVTAAATLAGTLCAQGAEGADRSMPEGQSAAAVDSIRAEERGYRSGQSVGLVLSGGGAKGIAHIGVIKALEDYNIPIDYIAGTSMGAIVGGLYACGYTPEEMIDLILS